MTMGLWRLGAAALAFGFASSALAQSHPDFSGIYFPAVGPGMRSQTPNPLPYNDTVKKFVADYEKHFTLDDDPGRYCIWPGMPRAIWGAPFTVEIQQRAQDLSIYWEGYGMYRKIYMADHNPPKQLVPSAMGHSVAHWDGETLVVETDKLKPYPYMTRMATSSAAHVIERLHLEQRAAADGKQTKYLVDEIVLTDPKVYTEPVKIKATLQLRPDLSLIEYTCTDTLWDDYLSQRGLTLPDLDALPGGGKE
jgi:hypothetical protein